MWETKAVQLTVRLPSELAAQAEEVQRTDPEFLSRVVLYGLTRRSIYRHLRAQTENSADDLQETLPALS
ncbi:MAG: hypothetical protein OEZ65_06925 [Gemmatimonadota bacterium]|nr:hypothetical protein [Gemmatimonadota bacterium]MDH5759305.1 hypothetical protein [Gemmatimonadota bacterium]